MSARCFCRNCEGRVVSRKTFTSHGRMFQPPVDEPAPGIPVSSMPDVSAAMQGWDGPSSCDDTDSSSDEDTEPLMSKRVDEANREASGVGKALLTKDEITMLFLDWISTFKLTDTAAQGAWKLMEMLLPEECDLPTFNSVKYCGCCFYCGLFRLFAYHVNRFTDLLTFC